MDPSEQKEFDYLFDSIFQEYSLEQEGYSNIIRAYLQALIIKIMRAFNGMIFTELCLNIRRKTIAHQKEKLLFTTASHNPGDSPLRR